MSLLIRILLAELDAASALPWAALMSLAHMTMRFPENLVLRTSCHELPRSPLNVVPWWSLCVIMACMGLPTFGEALGLQAGRVDGAPMLWSILCRDWLL